MMEGWVNTKISAVTSLITKGTTPSTYGFNFEENGEVNFIRAEGISKDGYIDSSTFLRITNECNEKLKRSKINENDILFSIAGMALGKSGLVKKEFLPANTNQAVAILRPNEKIDSHFFLYYIVNPNFYKLVNSVSGQAAQPNINLKQIGLLPLNLPPLPTQRKIASILSAYDDLIENNLKRIKLLEKKAQLTYEEWFVRLKFPGHETKPINNETGLPEGWEKVELSKIAEFLNGFAFKPKHLGNEGMPIIKIKEMKNGVVNDTPRNNGKDIAKKYLVENGDILFSWSATLEVVIWKYETGLLNQHLFKVTPKKGFGRSYVYLATKNSLLIFDQLTTGATMKHIKRKELDFVKLNKPPEILMGKFEGEVSPVIKKALNLSKQNQLLKEARDILLPRLMSGMIDVDQIKLENL